MAIFYNPGVPSAGTDKIDTLTIGGTPTSGTFTLQIFGQFTTAITWSATNSTLLSNINTAIQALNSVGSTGIVVTALSLTAGIGTITVTYDDLLGVYAFPSGTGLQIGANNLVGTAPTLAIAETTPGVTATQRGANLGDMCVDTTNGDAYINSTGAANAPIWNLIPTT